jgi:hypothetical protein
VAHQITVDLDSRLTRDHPEGEANVAVRLLMELLAYALGLQ